MFALAGVFLAASLICIEVMARIGLPASQTAPAGTGAQANTQSLMAPQPAGQPSRLIVTHHQRGYLDALRASGVTPSNDLLALSIGSYVCQARAANQGARQVWDFVLPLVRGDVRTADSLSQTPSAAEVNSACADYIRIATERLC